MEMMESVATVNLDLTDTIRDMWKQSSSVPPRTEDETEMKGRVKCAAQ